MTFLVNIVICHVLTGKRPLPRFPGTRQEQTVPLIVCYQWAIDWPGKQWLILVATMPGTHHIVLVLFWRQK